MNHVGEGGYSEAESTEAEFLLADAMDSSDLGMELCVLGVRHASLESVELAEGVLDTWTQVLPEEGKDPRRVALETECV